MLFQIISISGIYTMDAIASQKENKISDIQTIYNLNKESIKMEIVSYLTAQPVDFDKVMQKKPENMLSSHKPKTSCFDQYFAIDYVIKEKLFFPKEFLEFKVDNQSLEEELKFLILSINNIESAKYANGMGFLYLINTLCNVMDKSVGLLNYNNDLPEVNPKNLTKNFAMKIKSIAEILKAIKLGNINSPHTSSVHQQYDKLTYEGKPLDGITASSFISVFSSSEFIQLMKFMETLVIAHSDTTELTDILKNAVYDYYVCSAILSAIDQIFTVLWLMSETGFLDVRIHDCSYNNNKNYYLTFLINTVRECNVNIFMMLISAQDIRYNIDSIEIQTLIANNFQ